MTSTYSLFAAVALAVVAAVVAVPVGCAEKNRAVRAARVALGKKESKPTNSSTQEAEIAVLARLAKKIDELRELKVASLNGEVKSQQKIATSIHTKSVKPEVGAGVRVTEMSSENEELLDSGRERAETEAAKKVSEEGEERAGTLSLKMVSRLAEQSPEGSSFLTPVEQKELAEYVRVKMLRGTRDMVHLPVEPVVRPTFPDTLSRLTSPKEFLLQKEREALSRLIRSNGFQLNGGKDVAKHDSILGAFVRTALADEKIGATHVNSGLSEKDSEYMALKM